MDRWHHPPGRPGGKHDEESNNEHYSRVTSRESRLAGTSGARFAALKSGAVDATLLTDPFDGQAEADGFYRIDDLLPKYITPENYSGGGIITQKDWAKEHPNELAAYSRATRKTVDWIYDPKNKEEMGALKSVWFVARY